MIAFELYPYQQRVLEMLVRAKASGVPLVCFMPRTHGKSYVAAIARRIEAEKKAVFDLAIQRPTALQWGSPRLGKPPPPTQRFKRRAKWNRKGQ